MILLSPRIIDCVAAAVLAGSAAAKTYDLIFAPSLAGSSAVLTIGTGLLISFEFALAYALVASHHLHLLRPFAALLFALFAIVNLWWWMQGASTCGCFGSLVKSPPELTAVVDVVLALAFLLISRAKISSPSSNRQRSPFNPALRSNDPSR